MKGPWLAFPVVIPHPYGPFSTRLPELLCDGQLTGCLGRGLLHRTGQHIRERPDLAEDQSSDIRGQQGSLLPVQALSDWFLPVFPSPEPGEEEGYWKINISLEAHGSPT